MYYNTTKLTGKAMSELRDKVADIIEWGGSNFIGSMPSAKEDADEILALCREAAVEAVEDLDSGRENDYHDRAIAQAIVAINKALGGSDE